jgi:hypothetical protein
LDDESWVKAIAGASLIGAMVGCFGCSGGNPLEAPVLPDSGTTEGADGARTAEAVDGAASEAAPSDQNSGDAGPCSVTVPPRRLAVGIDWGCALRSDHPAECWGAPNPDQGQTHPPSVMLQAISAGDLNGDCALTSDGLAACWGGTTVAPTTQMSIDISGNSDEGCALGPCGDVTCWGTYESGVPAGTRLTRIAAGWNFACGIVLGSGTIQCWGSDDSGQTDPPQGTFTEIGAGAYHACAITPAGAVQCWGAGSALGGLDGGTDAGGNTNVAYEGQAIPPSGTFRAVAGGYAHTCAIRDDGTIACWGAGTTGTGCGSSSYDCGQSMPPAGTFQEVRPGFTNTCGIQSSGGILCWGSNTGGRSTPPSDFQ